MSLFGSLFSRGSVVVALPKTPLDLVTHTVSLVSMPDAVSDILDRIRDITSKLEPGQQPTAADVQRLLGIYLELETYLTTKEPVRALTKTDLRNHLDTQLHTQIETYEHNQKGT